MSTYGSWVAGRGSVVAVKPTTSDRRPTTDLLLDLPAGGFDLRARASAHLHAAQRHRRRNLAVVEHLRRTLAVVDEAGSHERIARDLAARHERQVLERHFLALHAKRGREAALRHATRDRHLAALEMRLSAARAAVSRARLAALVALAGRLARAASRTAAEALPVAMRARRLHQVVEPDAR